MTEPDTDEVRVTALLCDAAQVAGDKLFILGGGWTYVWPPEARAPTTMALAVQVSVPWNLANRRLRLDVRLLSEDGEQVTQEFGDVRVEGLMEAGRPPGARPGADLVAPFVVQYAGLQLDYGGYAWEVRVEGRTAARIPFQVAQRAAPPGA